MPVDNPLPGELWMMRDAEGRPIRGTVATITEHVITLVSFTGNRFHIAPSRLSATGWAFQEAPPTTTIVCARQNCSEFGILRVTNRDLCYCPRHMPAGTIATRVISGEAPPRSEPHTVGPAMPVCSSCERPSVIELDRFRIVQNYQVMAQGFQCESCHHAWAYIYEMPTSSNRAADDHYTDLLTSLDLIAERDGHRIDDGYVTQNGYTLFRRTDAQIPSFGVLPNPGLRLINRTITLSTTLPSNVVFDLSLRLASTPSVSEGSRRMGTTPSGGVSRVGGSPGREEPVVTEDRPARWNGVPNYHNAPELTARESVGRSRPRISTSPQKPVAQDTPLLVTQDSQWVTKSSGRLVRVTRVHTNRSTGTVTIHFREDAENSASTLMLLDDFSVTHRPFYPKNTATGTEAPVLAVDEEWENVASGEVATITDVDMSRELIRVRMTGSRVAQAVSYYEFLHGKWKKIVRRTWHERLGSIGDEDD